jgi:heparanase 1
LKELLDYTLATGYRNIYALEFGNELVGQHGIQAKFSPEQYSADFSRFVDAVGSAYSRHSESPPLTLVPGNSWDADWYSQFLKLLDGSHRPGIVSHHLYSLGGGFDPASGDRALDPAHLNLIAALADDVMQTLAPFQPPAPAAGFSVWVGEAGGAYNSGRDGVTNTFWSGFWCAAELVPQTRVAALVMRQQVHRPDGLLRAARPRQVLPPDVGGGKLWPAQHHNSAATARLLLPASVVPHHGPLGSGCAA